MCQSIHSAVTDLLFPKKKDDTPQLPTFEGDSDEVIFLSIPIQKFFLFILLYIDEEYVNMETQGQEIIPEFHSIIEKVQKNAVNIVAQV